ncbi:hypothetical protein LCGC14_0849210 [marine sediment metagenome]|uniref:Uncharacterized protein n=1 Tax=marine sediment metagenome TaxID=412755 RepID=A0A0F9SHV4_9ZZZZ
MATLEEIQEIVTATDGKVDQLLIWKASHTKEHELIERDVADSRAVLFENPGVVSKVNTLWNCNKDVTKWKDFWMSVLRYLIVAVIVAVVCWLLLLYKGISL